MIQLTAAMVGMLGGPALQVLMVLAIEREWRSLGFVMDMANLSEKTVHQAARKLSTLGYITERTMDREKVYRIAGAAYQLPLGPAELEPPVDKTVDNSVESPAIRAEEPTSSVKFTEDVLNESMNESMESINESHSFIDGAGTVNFTEDAEDEERPTAAALKDLGFYEPGIGQMLAIPGLTMREVRYHVETADSLGYALARIKRRQAVPENWGRDGPEQRKNYYLSGKFAEFIKH